MGRPISDAPLSFFERHPMSLLSATCSVLCTRLSWVGRWSPENAYFCKTNCQSILSLLCTECAFGLLCIMHRGLWRFSVMLVNGKMDCLGVDGVFEYLTRWLYLNSWILNNFTPKSQEIALLVRLEVSKHLEFSQLRGIRSDHIVVQIRDKDKAVWTSYTNNT